MRCAMWCHLEITENCASQLLNMKHLRVLRLESVDFPTTTLLQALITLPSLTTVQWGSFITNHDDNGVYTLRVDDESALSLAVRLQLFEFNE